MQSVHQNYIIAGVDVLEIKTPGEGGEQKDEEKKCCRVSHHMLSLQDVTASPTYHTVLILVAVMAQLTVSATLSTPMVDVHALVVQWERELSDFATRERPLKALVK